MNQLRLAVIGVLSVTACSHDAAPEGSDDGLDGGATDDLRGGQIHARPVAVDLAQLTTKDVPASLLAEILTDRDLAAELPAITGDQLMPVQVVTTQSGGGPLVHLSTRQHVDGIPIHDTYLDLTLRTGRASTELASSAFRLYAAPRVKTAVEIDAATAVAVAREALRQPDGVASEPSLAIWPLEDGLQLVWVVDLAGSDHRALVRANGAMVGEVTPWDDRVFDAGGVVRGWVAVGGAPGGRGVPQLLPLTKVIVSDGAVSTFSGSDGSFTLAGTGPTISVATASAAARVTNGGFIGVTAQAPAGQGLALELGTPTERSLAQVTALHFITSTQQFLLDNGFSPADFGSSVRTNVNVVGSCNAYFSPLNRSLNFMQAGNGCRNTAEASVIAHEYGHFVDDAFGGIRDGGLSEGWGDVLACLSRRDPIVGPDVFANDIIRTCDNPYQFPAGGSDEVHALGQAWSGFVWHARQAAIEQLGDAAGDALIRRLALPSLRSNAADIPAAVREVFLRDDDDGDLGNLTPHWDLLFAAAQQHGLGFVVSGDLKRPGAVADLEVTGVGIASARLRWTAPGDDGGEGTAATYQLRTSTAPITAENFTLATRVPAPDPVIGGALQEATITVTPNTPTYVAVRAIDEVGNQGAISNVIVATPAPPVTTYFDGAESGLGGWRATGLWHISTERAASGTHGFWYGDEAATNYHTPGPNSGTLTSPVIDLRGVVDPVLVVAQYLRVEIDPTRDLASIIVRDADDPSVAIRVEKGSSVSVRVAFEPRVIDLANLANRRIQIEFAFDSVDTYENNTAGWFIDDVTIFGSSAPSNTPSLVINEVLADPPAGWDSGGDGVASSSADEMIELLNVGTAPLDIGGFTLGDSQRTRHTFAPGTTIAPGGVLLVLGGGASTLAVPAVITTGLFLNNDGDAVRIRDRAGLLVAEQVYGAEGGRDSSLVHALDGDLASPIVLHTSIAPTSASPGKHSNGTPFGAPPPPPPAEVLVINEILADPPAGFDASGDGVASTTGDEMIELVNPGAAPIDLGGATISDAIAVRVTLPAGTVVPAHGALVVFGGGAIGLSIPGVVFVSAGTLSLNNTGDTVTVARNGMTLTTATYGPEGGADQSLVRAVEGDPLSAFVGHRTLSAAAASPGRRGDGGTAW